MWICCAVGFFSVVKSALTPEDAEPRVLVRARCYLDIRNLHEKFKNDYDSARSE
jgi:hypothetical protein